MLSVLGGALPASAGDPSVQVSLAGTLQPVVRMRWDLDGQASSGRMGLGGGGELRVEALLLGGRLALGGLVDATAVNFDRGTAQVRPVLGILASVRGGLPLGASPGWEASLRVAVGYAMWLQPADAPSKFTPDHGWTMKAMIGAQHTWKSGLGVFVEAGWAVLGLRQDFRGQDDDGGGLLHQMVHGLALSLGVAWRF